MLIDCSYYGTKHTYIHESNNVKIKEHKDYVIQTQCNVMFIELQIQIEK